MRLIIDRDVPVEMRDGTVLRADVYRPESDAPWPVLLQRTPYDKNVPRISALLLNPVRAASAGYAVVVQDVRGRFASDGDFYTFRHEPDDGYDTIAWAGGAILVHRPGGHVWPVIRWRHAVVGSYHHPARPGHHRASGHCLGLLRGLDLSRRRL